ncbi:LanC-like protein GCL1 [Tanacetum coccineum]
MHIIPHIVRASVWLFRASVWHKVHTGNPFTKMVGVILAALNKWKVFPDDREFKDVAIEAGEVVWKIGLLEKPRLADGASGNAYAFPALYHITGDTIYEVRAKSFGTDNQEKNEKQSQNDKTGLGMEKTVKDKAKSKPKSQSSQKVNRKVNWSQSQSTMSNTGQSSKKI